MDERESVRRLVEELSNVALSDVLRNVRHHAELRRRITGGWIAEQDVNRTYRDYAQREGPEYRRAAADLTMQYYSDLAQLGARYSEQFYAEVLAGEPAQARDGEPPSGSAPDDVEEVPVELHGPPGQEVVTAITLQNTEDHAVTLTLEVGPCRGTEGPPFAAPLVVQPAELVLEPGESRQVTLRLAMLASVFEPGHLYHLPVVIRGAEEVRLRLSMWAEEPAPPVRTDLATPPARTAPDPAPPGNVAEPAPAEHGGVSVTDDDPPATVPDTSPAAARDEPPASVPGTSPVSARGANPAAVADQADGVTSTAAAGDAREQKFQVDCPTCGRTFLRRTASSRLNAHRAPDRSACPTREGRLRSA